MSTNFLHPSYGGRVSAPKPRPAEAGPARAAAPGIDLRTLTQAERSCCCPAKPAVIALMPPTSGRAERTDLLLCMHHFRASSRRLADVGATVLDASGAVLDATGTVLADRERAPAAASSC
jgi:hypothetical protein